MKNNNWNPTKERNIREQDKVQDIRKEGGHEKEVSQRPGQQPQQQPKHGQPQQHPKPGQPQHQPKTEKMTKEDEEKKSGGCKHC